MRSTLLAAGTGGQKAVDYMFPSELRLLNDPYSIKFTTPFLERSLSDDYN